CERIRCVRSGGRRMRRPPPQLTRTRSRSGTAAHVASAGLADDGTVLEHVVAANERVGDDGVEREAVEGGVLLGRLGVVGADDLRAGGVDESDVCIEADGEIALVREPVALGGVPGCELCDALQAEAALESCADEAG